MKLSGVLSAVVIGCVIWSACSDSTGNGGGGGRSQTVSVRNNFFSPSPDTASSADSLTFTWSTPSNGHNVTWLTGPGTLPPPSGTKTSGTYKVLLAAGNYTYRCTRHLGMNGTVVME